MSLTMSLVLMILPEVASADCDDNPDYFSFTANTGDYYALIVDSLATGCELEICDEIGVFDGDVCVGAAVWLGSWPLSFNAWADDPQTAEVDGFIGGNPMSFKLWRASTGTVEELSIHMTQGDGTFASGIYARLWLECTGGCGDEPSHFQFTSNTGDYYALIVDSLASACELEICDEIGVFDGALCVGAAVYQGSYPMSFNAWADDPQTAELDGYIAGNEMTFKLWWQGWETDFTVCGLDYVDGDGTFENGIFARLNMECIWECGDVDGSCSVNMSDVVYLIQYIFAGGPPPVQLWIGDVDCSGSINMSDVVYLIQYIFAGGPAPCDPDGDGVPDCGESQ